VVFCIFFLALLANAIKDVDLASRMVEEPTEIPRGMVF